MSVVYVILSDCPGTEDWGVRMGKTGSGKVVGRGRQEQEEGTNNEGCGLSSWQDSGRKGDQFWRVTKHDQVTALATLSRRAKCAEHPHLE